MLTVAVSPCRAADLSAEQIRAILATAALDKPADLSEKSLENLDLSIIDLLQARELVSGRPLWGEIGGGGPLRCQPFRREARPRLDHAGEFH
jgi:hypothetical protein